MVVRHRLQSLSTMGRPLLAVRVVAGYLNGPRHAQEFAAAVGLVILVLLWSGCTSSLQSVSSSPAADIRPRSAATVAILSPVPGAVVGGTILHVKLSLTGGRIVPQTSTHLTPVTGHIHLILDGSVVSMAYGLDQEVPITKGPHLLQAEFVAADHFPFNPRVISVSDFTAQ
jgi:hypothetical protein